MRSANSNRPTHVRVLHLFVLFIGIGSFGYMILAPARSLSTTFWGARMSLPLLSGSPLKLGKRRTRDGH